MSHPSNRPAAVRPAGAPVGPARVLHAPETSQNIFRVIFAVACGPLVAGTIFFGWRALVVAAVSIAGCVATESLYYRITRTPALLGRSHAALTGLLLALTLPPFVPWYVPLAAAIFAIGVGKALFGGVGHFLWQPALVGRLAVAVLFAPPLTSEPLLNRPTWPVLARQRLVMGDVRKTDASISHLPWRRAPEPTKGDALLRPRPRDIIRQLGRPTEGPFDSITAALTRMPSAQELLYGAHGGGMGETCAIVLIVGGLYLIYRHYVPAHLPGMFLLAAAVTAAVAPVRVGEADQWQWLPVAAEGLDVGLVYVAYHLICGEVLLAAFFLATEMTSRPVTPPGQAVFGAICGAGAILIRMYLDLPLCAYAAVLMANTLTPALDGVIRRRALGQRRWWQKRRWPA